MSPSDYFSELDPVDESADFPGVEHLGQQNQLDFDIEFFAAVLRQEPAFVDVLRCQGEALARKGLRDESLEIDRSLVRLRPEDGIVRYNYACSLALTDHADEAVDELRRAFECGYEDFAFLTTDPDLDGLRAIPAYRDLMREYGIDD